MRIAALIGLLSFLSACSSDDARPETADKLKPILVLVNPPAEASNPTEPLNGDGRPLPLVGTEVTLQFHFIGPPGMAALTLTPAEVESKPLTLPITNWTVGAEAGKDYEGLRHVTIEAKASLPTAAELASLSKDFEKQGLVRLRYTLVVSDGVRELPVEGDFVVYRDSSVAGAERHLFGSRIDLPAAGAELTDRKVPIVGTLRSGIQDEPVKIGWYVSAGEIKNRRAASTEWELPGPGSYTLVFTVRGKESRNGDIQIRSVSMP